jgi:hypothetical protein
VNNTVLPVAGYLLLGMAGPCLQMPCFQFSELFAHRKVRFLPHGSVPACLKWQIVMDMLGLAQATAMAYLITFFELSTGVFWVFGELNVTLGWGRDVLFVGYAGVGFFCLVTALAFWPDMPYRAAPPPPAPQQRVGLGPPKPPVPVAVPVLMDKPLMQQVPSLSPRSLSGCTHAGRIATLSMAR